MFYCNIPNFGLNPSLTVLSFLNGFADFGLWIAQKCVWQPDSARTRWRTYSASPDPLAAIRGMGWKEGVGKGWE